MKDANAYDQENGVAALQAEIVSRQAMESATLLAQWNAEIASLYGKRMQEYWMLPFNLALCTSTDDLHDLQDRFCANLQADYRSAARMLARTVDDKVQEGDGESYAGVILAAQEDARAIIDQARKQAESIVADAAARAGGAPASPKSSLAA